MNAYDDEYELMFRRVRIVDENGVVAWVDVPLRETLAVAA